MPCHETYDTVPSAEDVLMSHTGIVSFTTPCAITPPMLPLDEPSPSRSFDDFHTPLAE